MANKKFKFKNDTVKLEVPGQAKKVKAVEWPFNVPAQAQAQADFQPFRNLANIVIVEEDNEKELVKVFKPPFELRVAYTPQDVTNAGGTKKLKLAYWDGSKWVKLNKKDHKFKLDPESVNSGEGVALISKWGDPPLAWGK